MSTRENIRVPPSGAFLSGGVVNDVLTRNADGTASWKTPSVAAAPAAFKGTYFIDPAFAGVSTGSASNPFTSYAATFAFALSQGITNGIFFQAPGSIVVENVVFPTTGEWELAAQPGQAALTTFISGNVDISATASARRALTNLRVTGNITGNCSAGTQRILMSGTVVIGTTTLTQTGAGIQRLATRSGTSSATAGGNVQSCIYTGAVSVAGTFWGSDANFATSVAVTTTSQFAHCSLPPTTTTTSAGTVDLVLIDCTNNTGGSLAFTCAGGQMRLRPDYATLAELQRVGTLNTGNVTMKALIGSSATIVAGGNFGVTPLSGILPAGLMVIEACLTLLTSSGGTAGLAVLNVTYTDMTGALVTEAVTPALNVAGALGSKQRGALQISQNGATPVSYSVTGITAVGVLTYELDAAARQAS
jgi:hypothetical protein